MNKLKAQRCRIESRLERSPNDAGIGGGEKRRVEERERERELGWRGRRETETEGDNAIEKGNKQVTVR